MQQQETHVRDWLVAYGIGGCWAGYEQACVLKNMTHEAAKAKAADLAIQYRESEGEAFRRGVSYDLEMIVGQASDCGIYKSRLLPEAITMLAVQLSQPKFKVGDVVCFTNEYGVKWHARRIVHLELDSCRGLVYYYTPSDAPWFGVQEKFLSLETLPKEEIHNLLGHDGPLRRHLEKFPNYLNEIYVEHA